MLSRTTKVLLIAEVLLCFGPATIFLIVGSGLIANLFLVDPVDWETVVVFVGSLACGFAGLAALAYVLTNLFSHEGPIRHPLLACVGIAFGLIPLLPTLQPDASFRWIGLLPMGATLHILILAGPRLFPSYRNAAKCVAVAALVASASLLLVEVFPFGYSESGLQRLRDAWLEKRPYRYEYTIQLSGWLEPEMHHPKRVVVRDGDVTSVTYAWDSHRHDVGDPAPVDSFWTIERALEELINAKRDNRKVVASFNQRWGYLEHASVDGDEAQSSWSIEVSSFVAQE